MDQVDFSGAAPAVPRRDRLRLSRVQRQRIALVATVPFAMNWFMRAHINRLSETYDVTLISSGDGAELAAMLGAHVAFIPVQIERRVSPFADLRALATLWSLFRRERFDAVHSIMPKSGLLSTFAARLAGVPHRIHTFTGQVWATKTGIRRTVLKSFDRLIAANATTVLADSWSQRAFLDENGIAAASPTVVLGHGSVVGVNLERFSFNASARREVRAALGISDTGVVFFFVGRVTRDKGVPELLEAFAAAAVDFAQAHLLIVGPDEDDLDPSIGRMAADYPGRVHRVGFVDQPERYMSASDVLSLPSHREGFGNVVVEAAAVGLPAIASRIYGLTDAVEDGVTGILHEVGNVGQMAAAITKLASNAELRVVMGSAARARAITLFAEENVTAALADLYRDMFARDGR